MRTTKRFTPKLLDFFRRQGRGTGTYDSYIPWHRVSRSDPASRGRSHLPRFNGRHVELLSDGEFTTFFFSIRLLKTNCDVREQYPLSLDEASHELTAYDIRYGLQRYPGTLQVAEDLNIKHPMTHGDGLSEPWVMSTDFLLMLYGENGKRTLLAISVKDKEPLTKRKKDLLKIEQQYWKHRGVTYLLITPNEFHPQVAETLHRTWIWALDNFVPESHLKAAQIAIHRFQGHSLTYLLNQLSIEIGDHTQAQHAVWQSIWAGHVPVDFRRGWRPHIPLQIISREEFDKLNPVLVRRSSWI